MATIDDKLREKLKDFGELNTNNRESVQVEILIYPDKFLEAKKYLRRQYRIKGQMLKLDNPPRIYLSLKPSDIEILSFQRFVQEIRDDTPLI